MIACQHLHRSPVMRGDVVCNGRVVADEADLDEPCHQIGAHAGPPDPFMFPPRVVGDLPDRNLELVRIPRHDLNLDLDASGGLHRGRSLHRRHGCCVVVCGHVHDAPGGGDGACRVRGTRRARHVLKCLRRDEIGIRLCKKSGLPDRPGAVGCVGVAAVNADGMDDDDTKLAGAVA